MGTKVCANSSPARCAIYSRDTAIRICSVPRLKMQKWVCQNLIMGQSYGPRRIFLPAITCLDFHKYGHILSKTLRSGLTLRLGRQAHGSTALALWHYVRCPWDFLGLVNTSRKSLVRNNERYLAFPPAVARAFLEISDLRTQSGTIHL
jgi:hypothetical protein